MIVNNSEQKANSLVIYRGGRRYSAKTSCCPICNTEFRYFAKKFEFCFECKPKVNNLRLSLTGQSKAIAAVTKAKKKGVLTALPDGVTSCSDCGKPATCYDHRDYNKPLEVDPVCSSCNRKRGPAKYICGDIYEALKEKILGCAAS